MKRQIAIIIVLIILMSYTVFSAVPGRFKVANQAPFIKSGSFAVQDSSSSFDSTNLNTHDITPNFKWIVDDKNPDQITTSICIGISIGDCSILPTTQVGTFSRGTTVNYNYIGSGITFSQTTDCSGNTCSKTYYVNVSVSDSILNNSQTFPVIFLNSIPNTPSALSPSETHNQTPILSWTALDPDDGSKDKWPADILTYHIQVGTSFGDESYLIDPASSTSSATVTNPIPWSSPGATQARTTVYSRVWSTDNLGIKSQNYEITFDLVDNLPQFNNIYLSDSAITDSNSCKDFLPQHCVINPLSGNYTSVNLKLKVNDSDADCSTLTHNAQIVLCKVLASSSEICNLTNNADYIYPLTLSQVNGDVCTFTASIPSGDSSGIEFFVSPGIYKTYATASSQAGTSTLFSTNHEWEYGTLPAMQYVDAVTLGDPEENGGDGIQLDVWNSGLSRATMINQGNKILNIEWTATDPSSDNSTCDGHTTTCWDLSTADDLQIDDDNIQQEAIETGLISQNIPESPTKINFNPPTGLQICDSLTCNSPTLDETIDTYFHIKPPLGLSPGDYETIFTIILNPI